jgi:hypothetical protein
MCACNHQTATHRTSTHQPIIRFTVAMQAAHQLRLQQLLESGRLTPATSPTPEQNEPPVAAAAAAAAKPRNNKRKKAGSKLNLTAVAESTPEFLPAAMNYIVSVSSRSPDVGLENDHNLHWYDTGSNHHH